ncbi:PKD domain-containing protein [Hymenobacter sp. HD11105]
MVEKKEQTLKSITFDIFLNIYMKYTNLFTGLLLSTGAILLSCEKEKSTPSIDFTYTGTLQNFTPIQFSASRQDISSYEWNFGDGSTSTEANPAHTFRRAGNYTVTLSTPQMADVTKSKTITLAQADTTALIRAKAVGQYYCNKIIVSYWNSGVDLRKKRLPETTLNVVAVGPDLIKVRHQTLYLFGVFTQQWPFSSEGSYYYFTDYTRDVIRYFGEFRVKANGDSLIYRNKIQFPSRAPDTIWYCRRLP